MKLLLVLLISHYSMAAFSATKTNYLVNLKPNPVSTSNEDVRKLPLNREQKIQFIKGRWMDNSLRLLIELQNAPGLAAHIKVTGYFWLTGSLAVTADDEGVKYLDSRTDIVNTVYLDDEPAVASPLVF